ncbi:MAG: ATP-binding protein [Candidatus Enterenecus sp.]
MKRKLRRAIKESVDNLPAGVCFADDRGIIILCNRKMHRLCRALMGTDLQNLDELRAALRTPGPGVTAVDPGSAALRFPDGTVWVFRESPLALAGGRRCVQMQAFDATELYEKRAELERENRALEETNARAKRLYAELDRTVREEETFAVKMRVHDGIGLCLLASRRALNGDCSPEELREAGAMWRRAMDSIGAEAPARADEGNGPDSADAALEELIASAQGIGVRVLLDGQLPRDAARAYLLITAMRECATNAVRHAGAGEMTVRLRTKAGLVTAVITNNGAPPRGQVTEGGGLSGLRRRVERAGGHMEIVSSPQFTLTITLPEGEGAQ